MTVKELREKLEKMPEDAVVICYDNCQEADLLVRNVSTFKAEKVSDDEDDAEGYYSAPYYCNGDSALFDMDDDYLEKTTFCLLQ